MDPLTSGDRLPFPTSQQAIASDEAPTVPLPPGTSSLFDSRQNSPVPEWEGSAKLTLFTSRSALTLFSIASAILLTVYSSSGVVKFEGEFIKWKLLLFTLQLEAALFVFVHDILAVAIDYLLVFRGMTRSQLGHAIGTTTSISTVQGTLYKVLVCTVTALTAIIAPVLLSVILAREGNPRVRVADLQVGTNCIGGRIGDNYGATGQGYIFNMSDDKFRIIPGGEHYATYEIAGTARQVFVPKTPQIGPYSTACNSDENADIVAARVTEVEGLLYKCEPTVEERAEDISTLEDVGSGTGKEKFRLLEDSHTATENDKATFKVSFAVKKDEGSTAILTIPCEVSAAKATLDAQMNDEGVMGLSVVDGTIAEISKVLPPRVLGNDENLLDRALENAIGRKGIAIVSKWVASNNRISEWDGLIRGVVVAYGIRAAFQQTFADSDDKRLAINVWKKQDSVEDLQKLRTSIIWIPVCLAVISRLLCWAFPTIFNGGLPQVLTWMGQNQGGAGGKGYRELGKEQTDERKLYLNTEIVVGGTSAVGLGTSKDNQLVMGSYKCLRRLTNRGRLTGFRSVGWDQKQSLE